MNKLSEYHKKQISIGLLESKKHKLGQRNKNVFGIKNPNWKSKISYNCPVCGIDKLVTKKQYIYLKKKNRACSRKCGNIIGASKRRGVKNKGASEYMKKNNHMYNHKIRLKASKTLKIRYQNGELNELKKKLAKSGKKNLIKYNKSIRGKTKTSIRMKKNNPMYRKEVAKKVSKKLRMAYKNGERTLPDLTGSRFLRGFYNDKNGTIHHYDSGWELERMKFLDNFLTIEWKKNRKEYKVGYLMDGKYRTYFPDFIVKRRGKNIIIIEEIGNWIGNKKIKIDRAKKFFTAKGIKYVVISSKSELQKRTW